MPKEGALWIFWRFRPEQVYIIHKVSPRYWRWWRGVVSNVRVAVETKLLYAGPG